VQVPQISVEEYAAIPAGEVVLLDVREPEEWADGHAAEAVHVPMNSVPATVAHDPGPLTSDTRIVVTCKAGGRSAQVTAWLLQNGFDAVNLDGGMLAWATAHRPMVSETGEPPSVR
jgi:rhodanese-related sulfurtransferase